MDQELIRDYYAAFGSKYLREDIFVQYPETKLIPAYIRSHFADAKHVLDLGFGTGLWFWASFLPSLERLDGIDSHPEALEEADKVFALDDVPDGYRLAHERIGSRFTKRELRALRARRGRFAFQDYRQPWPESITNTRYDLVTEHGGGLGQMTTDEEFVDVVRKAAGVLRESGRLLFVNFVMEHSPLEQKTGMVPSPAFDLRQNLFEQAAEQAHMKMGEFHSIDRPKDMPGVQRFFYGYAQK